MAAALTWVTGEHPWPHRVGAGAFGGGRLSVSKVRVEPTAVAEVSADAARTAGVFRHPLRFMPMRLDLEPVDVLTI